MNAYFAEHPLGMFGGMSDDEQTQARKTIDPNDPVGVKRLIAIVLKPEFDRLDDESQRKIRENLSYFLTVGFNSWDRLYEMSMPPIDPPDDPRYFFVWLWEVLFPGEDYRMADVSDVEVVNDIHALSVLRVKPE